MCYSVSYISFIISVILSTSELSKVDLLKFCPVLLHFPCSSWTLLVFRLQYFGSFNIFSVDFPLSSKICSRKYSSHILNYFSSSIMGGPSYLIIRYYMGLLIVKIFDFLRSYTKVPEVLGSPFKWFWTRYIKDVNDILKIEDIFLP